MNFKFTMIDNFDILTPYKESILELFNNCFEKKLNPAFWDWAYQNNPMGSPIVSLCHCDDKLVGHYAVIPYNLTYKNLILPACLSMTTMVHSSCRKYGLFVEQATQVYERAHALGYGVVFGFPNEKSTPGFRKRLDWMLDEPDYVAYVTLAQLADSSELRALLDDTSLVSLDFGNHSFMEWRLAKPSHKYRTCHSFVIKDFNSQEDIVALNNLSFDGHAESERYNILLDAGVTDLRSYEVFPYQFGYRALDDRYQGIKFKKNMLMSDVF